MLAWWLSAPSAWERPREGVEMEGQAFALQGLGYEAMPDCGERWEMSFLPGGLCPGVSGDTESALS